MKQIFKYVAMAVAMASMAACVNKEMLPVDSADEYVYTLNVGGATKAALSTDHMAWQAGDQIGWFTDKAGSSEVNMATTPRSFTVSSTAALAAGSKIYAYAPYTTAGTVTAAPLSIPVAQDGDAVEDAMPLVAIPVTLGSAMAAATDTPIGTAQFVNLGALLQYNVYTTNASYAAEKVESVKFTSASNIAGDFTVDLTAVAEDAIPSIAGLNQKAVTSTLASATTVGDSKANGIKVYQVIAPGSYTGTITVVTDKAVYEYNITSAVDFNRSKMKPVSLDLKYAASRVERAYWYEFANGDFGIGPAFDWGGWYDGYYYDMLTTPYVLAGASWSITDSGYFEWAGTQAESGWRHGIQLGTGGMTVSSFKLSSSSFPGTITSVTLGYNSGITDESSLSVSCTVGGAAFGSTVYHGDGDYEATFNGSASGEIEITLSSTAKGAVYLYYLYIEFDPSSTPI